MLNDLSTMKAVKKSSLFMAALCLFFAALFLLLLPGGVVRAEEFSSPQDETEVQDIGADQLDTASLITAAEKPVLMVSGTEIEITEDSYWQTDPSGTMKKVTEKDEWNVAYEAKTNTLTLNGATIKGASTSAEGETVSAGILDTTDNDLNIGIIEENTVTCGDASQNIIGIAVTQKLTLRGMGSLKVTTGAAGGEANFGIASRGIDIDGPNVTATCGSAVTSSKGLKSTDLNIISGSLTAVGGKVNDEAEKGLISAGIECDDLTSNGGTIDAKGSSAPISAGIHCKNSMTVNGGTIDTAGGVGYDRSYGILCNTRLTVNGGSVTAAAKESVSGSMGIWTKELKMTDGTIDAVSSSTLDFSYGLVCGSKTDNNGIEGSTEISGGQIRATANIDTEMVDTIGVGMLARGSFTMTGGEVTAAVQGKAMNGIGLGWYPSAQGASLNMAGGKITATAAGLYEASAGFNLYKYGDSYGNLNLSGGSITATGAPANHYSNGVNNYSDKGILNVTGGSLTATADQAGEASIGVGFENITITDGSVIAKSATAPRSSALQKEPDVSGYDAYHWRVAEGDAFANKPLVYKETTYFEIQPGALAEAAATNPPTGLDVQSNLLMMGAGLCLTALILWVGYTLYRKSQI